MRVAKGQAREHKFVLKSPLYVLFIKYHTKILFSPQLPLYCTFSIVICLRLGLGL